MKKALALALSVILCATALLTGTIAFFTDEEKQDNVFEVGNVNIEQHEKNREGNDFDQNQSLNPIVIPSDENKEKYEDYDDASGVQLRDPDYFGNYLDKIVTVENIGKNAAYVRNIVAIPTGLPAGAADVKWLEFDFLDANGSDNTDWTALENPVERDVEINGVLYDLYVFNYSRTDGKLQPKDTTLPTLLGFGMSSNVNFEEKLTKTGDTYSDEHGNTAGFAIEYESGKFGAYYYRDPDNKARTYLTITSLKDNHILVASQAVQVEGFEDFNHAFKNGFNGDITEKNHPWYEAPVEPISGYIGDEPYTWSKLVTEQLVTVTDGVLTHIDPSITELIISRDNVERTAYIKYEAHQLQKLSIGDGVKLGSNSFLSWTKLKSLTLGIVEFTDPSNSEAINQFCDCINLARVTMSEGITSIPFGLFGGCISLNNIVIPTTVEKIGNNAFMNCRNLSNITLPASFEDKMTDAEKERIFYQLIPSNIQYHS